MGPEERHCGTTGPEGKHIGNLQEAGVPRGSLAKALDTKSEPFYVMLNTVFLSVSNQA